MTEKLDEFNTWRCKKCADRGDEQHREAEKTLTVRLNARSRRRRAGTDFPTLMHPIYTLRRASFLIPRAALETS